jgi:hypothetical protein
MRPAMPAIFACGLDAPLALLIGTQAKQGWDKGETSLDSPPILRLASCRVRFRFAAGEPKAEGTWPPPMETLIQLTKNPSALS